MQKNLLINGGITAILVTASVLLLSAGHKTAKPLVQPAQETCCKKQGQCSQKPERPAGLVLENLSQQFISVIQ